MDYMKTLKSADGILAFKQSVKKQLAHYVTKRGKVCLSMLQRLKAV